ncbi:MAG: aminodeoxychorismate synthase component I [Gammaproteobacteria bacterium]|nr:aminodeoxychorismate synthase component I [Gammaproteobacteria bacterium]
MSHKAIQLAADFTIDPLALHLADSQRYPFLLQSTAGGTVQGRFDVLCGFPGERLQLLPQQLRAADFLQTLDQRWRDASTGLASPGALPFSGGWFVLLGYELAGQVEPRLALPLRQECPIAVAVRVPVALVRDCTRQAAWIVAEPGYEAEGAQMLEDLARCGPKDALGNSPIIIDRVAEPPAREFLDIVSRAREYIAAGDIFQANLSREWQGRLARGVRPGDIYARLRRANPGPFAGLAVLDELAVISSSPERLVSMRDGRVETRPIAGTRPRSAHRRDDGPLREELLANPKERAEHVMLIDLERNDLGRICKPGTVEVDEFMVIESYSHVHHIVSNVAGELRGDITPGQTLRAVFPGGTITGCPKVRCMEIIAELEARPRGFYTGAMGYLNHDGSGDFNILIRTIETQQQDLALAAGSGIVADSEPERELEETRAKAKGMLLALQ